MADSPRPSVELFDELFEAERLVQDAGLNQLRSYLAQDGSIFPLVEKGVQGLVREYQLNADDARQFLHRANSMATYVRRQFIEQTLRGGNRAHPQPKVGLLAMVNGPMFDKVFPTDFDAMCPPGALESYWSPAAYLIDLLRWIRDNIDSTGLQKDIYRLHQRRHDLKPMRVDLNAVYQLVSSVDITVSVLETFIKAQKQDGSIEDALYTARYPNGLPYYQHWVTLDGVARANGLSVGDFARTVELSYPWFVQSKSWTDRAERALAHASRLGPYQRQLLTEAGPEPAGQVKFYQDNYGTGDDWKNLKQVRIFGAQTKLDTPGIERLLSIRDFAPERSLNVSYATAAPNEPESGRSGSVYLNKNAHPAVHIRVSEDVPAAVHSLVSEDPPATVYELSAQPDDVPGLDRYDRMNRMVRLCNWLELSSDSVDALLVAAIRAEVRGGATAGQWWISKNTVHALGLYRTLHERYNCTAADFAVFLDELGVYGRGEALSQFDQVFNNQGAYREPFKLDDAPFAVTPAPGEADLTINQLCFGLGIDPQTYQYLALTVAKAHGLTDTLKRSAPIISSFYRLVKLPRLLNMTPVEGGLMLTLVGGEDWLNGLAGPPKINASADDTPDVLNLIDAMQAFAQWCEQARLPVLWVLQHVAQAQPAGDATEQDLQFFDQIHNLLPMALFSNANLLMAGVPPAGPASWMDFLAGSADLLNPVIDANGLVLAPVGTPEQYLTFARAKLARALDDALGKIDETVRAALVETMLSVLLQARDAQVSLVRETLSVYAGVAVDQAILVLNWANSTVYQLLQQVNQRPDLSPDVSRRASNEPIDPLLTLLADVRRRADVVKTLDLSTVLLQDYLEYGHRGWIGQADKHALSVRTLYYLSVLTRAFSMSQLPAQKLLTYLRRVNHLPADADLSVDAARLAEQAAAIMLAEFFGWSAQEVRECVSHILPEGLKVLKNLSQLDLLMRVRALSANSGMEAQTIIKVGTLSEDVDLSAYAEAAELALLSETRSRAPVAQLPADLSQLVTITCVPDNTEVIAGKPGEKVTFTVTVKDAAGEPLSGVTVYWQTKLGHIETKETQVDGTLKAEYFPGKVMGTDTPRYWLDMFEPKTADSINIIADNGNLQFPLAFMSKVPLDSVPTGHEVELYARLMDRYGNVGRDNLVTWASVNVNLDNDPDAPMLPAILPTIRPANGFTDQDGLTRVFVSSAYSGTFVFSVLSQSSEQAVDFPPITFEAAANRL